VEDRQINQVLAALGKPPINPDEGAMIVYIDPYWYGRLSDGNLTPQEYVEFIIDAKITELSLNVEWFVAVPGQVTCTSVEI
jgi:hypothetical protein